MNRTRFGLAAGLVILAASFAGVSADDDRDGGEERIRALVKRFEAQVESQRTALKQTEASLEQARGRLNSLEAKDPIETKIVELRVEEGRMEQQLRNLRRRLRHPEGDPAVVSLTKRLATVQPKIKALAGD